MISNNAQTFIVIPSYEENENLLELLTHIRRLYASIPIVIVDDSSEVDQLILKKSLRTFRYVHLIARKTKSGRGSAVQDGIRYALGQKDVNAVIEMDADLSHRPVDLVKLMKASNKADIIVGSRYVPGSKIVNWPKSRHIQSIIINTLLQLWLGVGIHDYTNGLRFYNKSVAQFISRNPLKEPGYIALSEIAYLAYRNGFTLYEVPITFMDRSHGKSKADMKELIASLAGAVRIRIAGLIA